MRVLLVTPPMVQVNAPYPATACLAGFLKTQGYDVPQADASLELALRLFSSDGVQRIAAELDRRFARRKRLPESVWHFRRQADAYRRTMDDTIRFLQGGKPGLARRILSRRFLPEGPRFANVDETTINHQPFNHSPFRTLAIHLASIYLDDVVDAIRDGVDARFELARYAEKLAACAPSFDPLAHALEARPTRVDRLIDDIADDLFQQHQPEALGLTLPFPGNVYGAFRLARRFKALRPGLPVIMGGGYVSTELRDLADPRVFDYADYVVLDDGELPLLRLLEHLEGQRPARDLLRTFLRRGSRVVYRTGNEETIKPREAPVRHSSYVIRHSAFVPVHPSSFILHPSSFTPAFDGLPLGRYFSMAETLNPMHRLWSCGQWNKLALAHGCYWRQCAFCDTSLDYIRRYNPTPPDVLADRIEAVIAQTGQTGFHFVDEAIPPALIRQLAERLLDRRLKITWWGNVRFDKAFTPDLANLMARSGCVAVTGGLEAATNRLLRLMNKGFALDQVARVAHSFAQAGILVHAYLMYGCPSQTEQDTVDSLEFVRQLFETGCIQSAYWHRFALTVHSPICRNPKAFGLRLLPLPKGGFARNEAPYRDRVRCDHAQLGEGLRRAVYNYMRGVGLEAAVTDWFDAEVPPPSLAPGSVRRLLKRGADTRA